MDTVMFPNPYQPLSALTCRRGCLSAFYVSKDQQHIVLRITNSIYIGVCADTWLWLSSLNWSTDVSITSLLAVLLMDVIKEAVSLALHA